MKKNIKKNFNNENTQNRLNTGFQSASGEGHNNIANPHKKRLILFIVVCTIVLVGIATTYAFFRATPTGTNEEISLTSGTVSIIFSDGTTSFTGELHFGESATKTFKLENNGSVGTTVNILWDDLVNTYLPQSLSYVLEESDNEDGDYTPITPVRNVPTSAESSTQSLASNIYIDKDTTKYYKLTITLNYLDDIDQTADLKAILSTHFNIKETIFQNGLMARTAQYDKFWQHAENIKKVVFEPTMSPKENASYTYDVSANQNGSVMSYLVPETDDNTKYTLYIQSDGNIIANPNSSQFFWGLSSLEEIEGLNNLDTSNVTTMKTMFAYCGNLKNLDLSNFNTSNVTTMYFMFYNCAKLKSLNVSNFDTSNVTTMHGMFSGSENFIMQLIEIKGLENFDTTNVTSMQSMFQGCSALTNINVSSFDTSNVTDMQYMFNYCQNLSEIKGLENFNTENVTNMEAMFQDCVSLQSLNLSNFNTSKVTDMASMFAGCSSLTSLDLNNFDTSNVINMDIIFGDCSNLKTLNISNLKTDKVIDMSYMFYECNNLLDLNLSNFNTGSVTNMYAMFYNCKSLETLDLNNFDTSNVTNMAWMFCMYDSTTKLYDSKLVEIKGIENFDTSNVTNMSYMFYGCYALTDLNLSNFNTSKVTNMSCMFYFCNSLATLDVSNFDTSNVTNMSYMFCMAEFTNGMYPTQLKEIKGIENFKTENVTDMSYMFYDCSNITSLDLSNFNTSKVTNMRSMFRGCSKLETLNLSNFDVSLVTDKAYFLSYVPSTIKVTLNSDAVKQWIMGTAPLTDDNFIMITEGEV